jgi:hypothetical protein
MINFNKACNYLIVHYGFNREGSVQLTSLIKHGTFKKERLTEVEASVQLTSSLRHGTFKNFVMVSTGKTN